MNGYVLLRKIELVRPLVGSLIQTMLAPGDAGQSFVMAIVNENGEPTASVRTIVRAMEVLDNYGKTADFGAAAPSRALHAYGVVERAISEQRFGSRGVESLRHGSSERREFAGDLPSGSDSSADDLGSGDP